MDWHVKQYPKQGKVVVWENDITGAYKIPMHDTDVMPSRYQMQGYVRKELTYWEHKSFCKRHGLVNHAMEDVRGDGDLIPDWNYLKGIK